MVGFLFAQAQQRRRPYSIIRVADTFFLSAAGMSLVFFPLMF